MKTFMEYRKTTGIGTAKKLGNRDYTSHLHHVLSKLKKKIIAVCMLPLKAGWKICSAAILENFRFGLDIHYDRLQRAIVSCPLSKYLAVNDRLLKKILYNTLNWETLNTKMGLNRLDF